MGGYPAKSKAATLNDPADAVNVLPTLHGVDGNVPVTIYAIGSVPAVVLQYLYSLPRVREDIQWELATIVNVGVSEQGIKNGQSFNVFQERGNRR